MKISRVSVWGLPLPLAEPYSYSGGRLTVTALDSTIVRIDTDDGLHGWGEACSWGDSYLPAHGAGARAALQTLAPFLLGRDPRAVDDINRAMDFFLPGHWYAKSAADIACWDILGKFAKAPLWLLLGAEKAKAVAVNSSIPQGTPEEMIANIARARAAGYKTHSAKIGGGKIAEDIARINTITAALPEDENITFDINRAWVPARAVEVLNSVAFRGWIEQPCETLEQCAFVAARAPQSLMLDECLHTFDDHLAARQMRACAGIKIKPLRAGGLTKARRLRDFAENAGWQTHIEATGGTVLADAAAIHLASSTAPANRLASWLCHPHLTLDIAPGQGARNTNGFAAPPNLPGIGVAPDENILGKPSAVYE